jgi:hypothetical protein
MANRRDREARRGGLSAIKLILIVVILLLVPTTMDQLAMHEEQVRLVGRVCLGIALLFFLYGLLTRMLRYLGLVVLALIVVAGLASEGIIDLPQLLDR